MFNLLWSGVLMLLLVSGCGWKDTPTRINDFIPLTSIEIVAASSAIQASQKIAKITSTKLTAIGNFAGMFTRDITDQVVWSSGTPSVADFKFTSDKNRVTGSAPGSAIITAKVGSVSSAPYTLTVSDVTVTSMTISPPDPFVALGLTTQFNVSGEFTDNTTQDLTFDATWSSDAVTFATVSDEPASKGLAKTVAIGSANIKAAFDAQNASTKLTVTAPVLQSITVTPKNSTIRSLSETVNFKADGTFSDGSIVDITALAAWQSSLPAVATIIASSGVATTLSLGTTSISATLNGVTGSTNLTVTNPVLIANGLAFSPVPSSPQVLSVNTSITFKVIATFTDGTTQDVTDKASWTSSDGTKATASNGLITGVAIGLANITASYLGQSLIVNISVQ